MRTKIKIKAPHSFRQGLQNSLSDLFLILLVSICIFPNLTVYLGSDESDNSKGVSEQGVSETSKGGKRDGKRGRENPDDPSS